jgi:hypothetical protein
VSDAIWGAQTTFALFAIRQFVESWLIRRLNNLLTS